MSAPATAVAKYILDRCAQQGDGEVTPMQLIKLTYVAHAWMLGLTGKPLIDEQVAAWQYGPVIPSLYHEVKHYRSLPVRSIQAPRVDFTQEEKNILDQVVDIYGKFTGIQLSAMTHRPDTPWEITWKRAGKNAAIPNDLIETFYKAKAARGKDAATLEH
ncbi:putative phage-associated protein [Xanthomonas arboricola]|uniref:Panacea domain-containing protein n=1 Tax=Xanthomonas TaxID=338 RepID=UPI000CEEC0EB|nr:MULTISPECIES: type II toxin-antitoxin system antitoxin SocA domain-containing protein [Xanthomonas]MBB5735921.1 putative phage-associated protein [Xanthomonas sp. CFBP 8152]PPT81617.1 hypothetical protein XarbCFBP8152_01090 [Xanthomonas arboricola]